MSEIVEVMGQCQECLDLLTIELKQLPNKHGAPMSIRGLYYDILPGRAYSYTRREVRHAAIVPKKPGGSPCHGIIHLRGGLTPIPIS